MTAARGLALVIADISHTRLHGALSLAAAMAARGRAVEIFCHAEGVRLLDPEQRWAEDQAMANGGLPTITQLLQSVVEMGGRITACQSGLALTGMSAETLGEAAESGGLVSFLARTDDMEIILV